jgi:ribonuclease E
MLTVHETMKEDFNRLFVAAKEPTEPVEEPDDDDDDDDLDEDDLDDDDLDDDDEDSPEDEDAPAADEDEE